MIYIYSLLAALPFILALDLLWLGLIARDWYQSALAHLVGPTVVWPAAIIFYILFALGLSLFVIVPSLATHSLTKAILLGAAFGFFAYATYDLTNLATLKDWPLMISIVDMLWGAFISGVAAGGAYLLLTTFAGY